MASDPKPPTSAAPDRLFARTAGIGFGAGLAVILAGHLVLDRAQGRQGATAALAMAATAETAGARAVVATLERLAAGSEGADPAAATRLDWDTDRLLALDARRIALTQATPSHLLDPALFDFRGL